jgi:hypothetical protein
LWWFIQKWVIWRYFACASSTYLLHQFPNINRNYYLNSPHSIFDFLFFYVKESHFVAWIYIRSFIDPSVSWNSSQEKYSLSLQYINVITKIIWTNFRNTVSGITFYVMPQYWPFLHAWAWGDVSKYCSLFHWTGKMSRGMSLKDSVWWRPDTKWGWLYSLIHSRKTITTRFFHHMVPR